jgi:hypothetical protein
VIICDFCLVRIEGQAISALVRKLVLANLRQGERERERKAIHTISVIYGCPGFPAHPFPRVEKRGAWVKLLLPRCVSSGKIVVIWRYIFVSSFPVPLLMQYSCAALVVSSPRLYALVASTLALPRELLPVTSPIFCFYSLIAGKEEKKIENESDLIRCTWPREWVHVCDDSTLLYAALPLILLHSCQ